MLTEAAQRRILADRKERWMRFQLAKEAVLAKRCGEFVPPWLKIQFRSGGEPCHLVAGALSESF
jgi:hypothetical protein